MAEAKREEVLAIIPARGGSKGIPGKNLRPLAGRPLLAHTLEQVGRTPGVCRRVVSTDDTEIADVARRYGAEVVRRPAEISGDTATSESALLHVLDHLRETEGYEPSLVVFLQATSPLRDDGDIQGALKTLREEEADSLFSACRLHAFLWRRQGGQVQALNYDYRRRPRRQEAPEDLIENGSIYVFKPAILREHGNRLGGKIAVYVMSARNSLQVDEPEDLRLIEQLLYAEAPPRPPREWAQVRLLALDFDGVLTDNRVWVDQTGGEAVACHRGDGWGIARLRDAGVEVVVLSTETNPVVGARCAKVQIACRQGLTHKGEALRMLIEEHGLSAEQVMFVGNDENDVGALRLAGWGVAVADAHPAARAVADWQLCRPGGHGAVREVCDLLTAARRVEE